MEQLEQIRNAKPDVETRVARSLKVGSVAHQGDVYVHRVPDNHPRGKETGARQVAVGTTVGSRHVAQGAVTVFEGKRLPEGVVPPEWCGEAELLGPVVVADGPWTLAHPEHAHHQLPAGTFQVTYQADFATQQRVAD